MIGLPPKWVLDLIADLIDEEDIHPKLYADTINGYVRWPWCPALPLARVPADVMTAAKAIAAYREKPTTEETS